METIVFIGSNKSGTSRDALRVSEELGYFTVLITDREKFVLQREEFHEVHQMIYVADLLNKEHIYNEIKKLETSGKVIKGCMSLIDPFVHFAATLSKELGLVELSTDAIFLMEDKTRFRKVMKNHPATPLFDIFKPNEGPIEEWVNDYHSNFPLIIKSPVSNGSKDVMLVETKEKLKQGMNKLCSLYPHSPILIEEYVLGPQYLVEVVVYKSNIHIVGVIEQEITNLHRFIVTGYSYPALLSVEDYLKLEKVVNSILCSLGLTHGSCHLEIRFVKGEWKLIEINPRISGGAMNRIIYEGSGIDLVKETVNLNLGEEPSFQRQYEQYVYVKYLTVNSPGKLIKVTGRGRASKYEGVKDVYVKPRKGSILVPPLSMGDRYAYVLAAADSPEKAKDIATNGAKEIRFYLEPI
ncbi:ATP-grasp domain-containing protein [Bacillus salitolerans]|uniref:ATP-grasp domain-containing protein n=1 Tax=Bacillus salitolerans TaxID=1437434 RepID=A0ABW4LLU5_9BACI